MSWNDLQNWLLNPHFLEVAITILKAMVILLVGIRLMMLATVMVDRKLKKKLTNQQFFLLQKAILWGGWVLVVITVINQLGFKITTVLGAAGVLSVAVAFAAQTSASNLISGVFLIFERPFQVGDIITIGATTGAVHSIDLLSVKLRKFDNCFVRIPNELIIKEQVSNITNFPLRRVDIVVGIAYKEDLERTKKILLEVAENHPQALSDPEPVVVFTGFGASSQDILMGVWAMKEDFLAVRNGITYGIKKAFDQHGIEIPFPHLSIYAGEATAPIPMRIERPAAIPTEPPVAPRTGTED